MPHDEVRCGIIQGECAHAKWEWLSSEEGGIHEHLLITGILPQYYHMKFK